MSKETKTTLTKLGFGIACMFGVFWVYLLFIQSKINLPDYAMTIINLAILYGIGLPLFMLIIGKSKNKALDKNNLKPKQFLACFAMQFTATMVLTGLSTLVLVITNTTSNSELNVLDPVMLFMLLIFNPIVEEFVFRKLFADKLRPYGDRLFIFISAFCFSIVHGVSLGMPQIVYTFLLGLTWAYVYVKTNNIWWAIFLHSLSNLFGSIVMQTLNVISPMLAALYLLFTVVIGITGLVTFLRNRKKIDIESNYKLVAINDVKLLVTSPGMIFYILLTVSAIVIKTIMA